ncbi:MAG: YccS family putative transporter [Cardiobacteriaceae bacterium]|nr:YccS family putative transporter [Cardiobacteriaceae bacterium]
MMRRPLIDDRILATLPVLIACVLVSLIVSLLERPDYSIALMLGVIAGGLTDMDHRISGRLQNLLIMLIAFSAASIAVQLARGHAWAMVAVMTTIAFAATFLGALDGRYRTLAFGTLTVALYTILSEQQSVSPPLHTLLLVSGALLYQLCTLAFHLLYPQRPVQTALAAAYGALADYIAAKAAFFDPDERDHLDEAEARLADKSRHIIATFNQCRDALFVRLGRQTLQARSQRQLRDYFIAQDIHERISSSHSDYRELTATLAHSDTLFRIARLIRLQSRACGRMARDLLRETPYRHDPILDRALTGLQHAWQQRPAAAPDVERIIANLARINTQLSRLASENHADDPPADARLAMPRITSPGEALRTLAQHLTLQSPYCRHALRTAILAFASTLAIETLHLPLGYWILLTAIFVIQPNYAATQSKVRQRISGTVAGVLAGALIPVLAPSPVTLLTLQTLAITLFFHFRAQSYSHSTFFITIQVFIGFAVAGHTPDHLLLARLGDTLLGVGIAWLGVHLLWPDWRYHSLAALGKAALESQAAYLRAILAQHQGAQTDDIDYRISRRRAHENAAILAQYAADSARDPARYHHNAAQTIVQHNYRILASLSALGASRPDSQQGNHPAPEHTCAENIAALLENSPRLDSATLDARIEPLRQNANNASPAERQLQRILDHLTALHGALLGINTKITKK